jgi:hypothetical protein
MPRRIFGPMRKEMAGGWRKLDNEALILICIISVHVAPSHRWENKRNSGKMWLEYIWISVR